MTGTDPGRSPNGSRRAGGVRLSKDPWQDAPVEELQDQVLPRWFVLLAIAAVVVAVGTLIAAFGSIGRSETPVAERRPPPADAAASAGGLTHDVGAFEVGGTEPVAYDQPCPSLEGVQVAGTAQDQATLRRGLAATCNVAEGDVADALQDFAEASGIVRFATFTETGVDSTATVADDPPQVLVNARFSRSDPLLIAPLIAHDVIARRDPGDAATELAARSAEADVCGQLFDETPRSCEDAMALVELPDPVSALRAAGYE